MILTKNRRYKYNLLIDSNVMNEFAEVELLALVTCNKLKFWKTLQNFAKQRHTISFPLGE